MKLTPILSPAPAPGWWRAWRRCSGFSILGLLFLLGASVALATGVGSVDIPWAIVGGLLFSWLPWIDPPRTPQTLATIVLDIRLPRVLLGGLVGAALAVAGATYQGLFRNPLAEPYLLGGGP